MKWRRRPIRFGSAWGAACCAFLLLWGNLASGAGLEKLLMPGRVIEGHADIESQCSACHDSRTDKASTALCMDCHEDTARDREARQGFHGRFPAAQRSQCVSCHTDHEGRNADIVGIQSGLFDHRWTDFALKGKHTGAICTDCHAPEQSYRDAPQSCNGCHEKEDTHKGGLGPECASCHVEKSWKEARFDHDSTGYSLTGGHSDVACSDCHQNNSFASTLRSCASCHTIDDIHAGANGNACQDCHSTSNWSGLRFDHASTGFALINAHAGLQCKDCHQREDFKDAFANGCIDCHREEDDHQGRNGGECASCHQPKTWRDNSFDHAKTGFALQESHSGLNCSACHKAASAADVPDSCGSCHTLDDSHAGELGDNCGSCHTATDWVASLRFDHDLSSFPLTGLHATVACESCHSNNLFKSTPEQCIDCHRGDDIHQDTLGDRCGTCHTSNSWRSATFDHDLQTDFKLLGGHKTIECSECHRSGLAEAADTSSSCGTCHAKDDNHDGQFGKQCGQCHSDTSFKDVTGLGGRSL